MTTIMKPSGAIDAARRLVCSLGPEEQLLASAVGRADSEPWRRIGVGVSNVRMLWIDLSSGAIVSATYDAIERVSFHSFESPPWPMHVEATIMPRGGVVQLERAGHLPQLVEGPVRVSTLHDWLDTVRLAVDDGCRLELALRNRASFRPSAGATSVRGTKELRVRNA